MQAREWLKQARSVAVLTGAGVSAESGIPTFRDNNGLWRQFRAEQLATPEAFANDPELVWEWYDWRRRLIAAAQPNAGHFALAEIERRVPRFTLITQNVDDLHERAGSRNVMHLHGSIFVQRCLRCARESTGPRPPKCECGGMLRPGVVWFGEALPPGVWEAAEQAVRSSDLLLVVGTSGVVYPAAGLARLGKRVVEVNAAATALSDEMDEILEGPSGEILPRLIA
ncbi:MAG TPA: NAD-dependent deacylase [Bryobacteraceae bacterium]|nr:NAD-dependent deacylase [Bryobacteraceae bacterium]